MFTLLGRVKVKQHWCANRRRIDGVVVAGDGLQSRPRVAALSFGYGGASG